MVCGVYEGGEWGSGGRGICCYMCVNVCADRCVRGGAEADLRHLCLIDVCVLTQAPSLLPGNDHKGSASLYCTALALQQVCEPGCLCGCHGSEFRSWCWATSILLTELSPQPLTGVPVAQASLELTT